MAYFSNSSDGSLFDEQCCKCRYGEGYCPIQSVQSRYNYDACNNPIASAILDELVKQDGTCAMFALEPNNFIPTPENGDLFRTDVTMMTIKANERLGLADAQTDARLADGETECSGMATPIALSHTESGRQIPEISTGRQHPIAPGDVDADEAIRGMLAQTRKYGLQVEVVRSFAAHVAAGSHIAHAAWCALDEWDLLDAG